jgi:hypothetical protein
MHSRKNHSKCPWFFDNLLQFYNMMDDFFVDVETQIELHPPQKHPLLCFKA